MHYVFCTLSCDQAYTKYEKGADGSNIVVGSIFIAGKANITNKNLITPKGMMTEVSDSDMEFLMGDYHFNEHVKNGFITVESKAAPVESVVRDMKAKDSSAPKTQEDLENDDLTVSTGTPKKKKG